MKDIRANVEFWAQQTKKRKRGRNNRAMPAKFVEFAENEEIFHALHDRERWIVFNVKLAVRPIQEQKLL